MQIWNITYDISGGGDFTNDNGISLLGREIIDSAKNKGADMAEAFLCNNRELSIEVRNGGVETLKLAEDRGLGVRVIKDQRAGFAYTSDLSRESIANIVAQALTNASSVAPDPFRSMPAPAANYPYLDLHDPQIMSATVEEKIELARIMEDTAKKHDSRIKIIESSSYTDYESEVSLINSLGADLSYNSAFCGIYLAVVAIDGNDSQTGFSINYQTRYNLLDGPAAGREAASRAVRMLGARAVPSQVLPVILEPYVATGFLGLLAPALTAEAVQKGRSLFAGRAGQKVASEIINITDDGTLPGGINSAPFDGEGVPASRKKLISGGVLEGFLHNTYTAAKDGTASTGNGVRSSYKSPPEVGETNLFIERGSSSREDMIGSLEKGFLVTEVMGMHTANPISGDFSVGVSGLMIENGRLAYPVKGAAIAGNIIEILKKVKGVGNDLTFFGGRGSPTLLISEISLSGQ